MKTSKEIQLKILDKMKENVKRDQPIFDGLYRVVDGEKYILNGLWNSSFRDVEHGIYPETIEIRGVVIPMPLDEKFLSPDTMYYFVANGGLLYNQRYGRDIIGQNVRFIYETKEEAIEASKKIFGFKE